MLTVRIIYSMPSVFETHAMKDIFSGPRKEADVEDLSWGCAIPSAEEFAGPESRAQASLVKVFDRAEGLDSTTRLPRAQQRLTINGRFLTQNLTGVQRYAREIVSAMDTLLQDERWGASLTAKIIVPSAGAHCLDLRAIRTQTAFGRVGGPVWTQCLLPILSRGVLLSLGNIGPVISSNQIICIHDLNTYLAPDSYSRAFRYYYRIILPLLAKRAARVVTVSKFSARMLDEFKLCPPEKITIIPNGHEHVERWRPERSAYASSLSGNRPFVFVLGSRALHKNVQILFDIARDLDALGLDILVAGAPNRFFSPVEQSAAPNVRMLGFVTDDDLAALYHRAFCFAFPSLTEGFGLPALEAMALGCPVIVSGCASLPEVCGNAALYADPKSPRAWLDQIKRLLIDPDLAATLRASGRRQAACYSWTKSARLYLDMIMSLSPRAAV
jgi:glycosyltransferase involved in cell wall biosynthesis